MKWLSRGDRINWIITFTITLFLINVFYYYINHFFPSAPTPRTTFLPDGVTRFGDFYGPYDQWSRLKFSGVGYGLSYFPSTYSIVSFLTNFPIQIARMISIAIFLGFFIFYCYKNIKESNKLSTFRNVMIMTFMSYPVLFEWHTANLESYVFIFLALFIYLFEKKNIL